MKKIEIKRFAAKSVFKAVIMAVTVPFFVIFAIIILCFVMGGIPGSDQRDAGKPLASLLPMVFAPVVYGLIFMLFTASYNWLAPRFGGLEIEVDDKNVQNDMESV